MKVKSLIEWEESNQDLDKFLSPGDFICCELWEHILCGYMASVYHDKGIGQGGDPETEIDGVLTYATVIETSFINVFMYVGILPCLDILVSDDEVLPAN